MNIPNELKNELNNIGAIFQKVIFANENKGRYTIQILWNNAECILKWNDKNHKEHLDKLMKEIDFYKKLQVDDDAYLPKIFCIAENYIIMEKLIGDSARNALIHICNSDNKRIIEILDGIRAAIRWLYLENEIFDVKNTKIDVSKEINNYIYKMLNSGPMNTKNNFWDEKVLILLSLFITKKVKKVIPDLGSMVHGDLHLNNFFAIVDGKVCILDWENTKIGSRDLELAYLFAQVNYLLIDNDRYRTYWKDSVLHDISKLNMSEKIFMYYADLFTVIIECNPRYGYNVKRRQIVKSRLRLVRLK